ncbi:hypothetical protein JZU68_08185, partial [bacterium]|nr:hypothetical protein [bacterium]
MNGKTHTINLSDLDLDKNEIYLNLGYGGTVPDEHFVEMVQEMLLGISEFCKPMVGYCINKGTMPDNKFLVINNQQLKVGQTITKYLNNCTHFAVFVVTVGVEFDDYCNRLKADGDIVSEFIAYSIGTEIAEAAVRFVSTKITNDASAMIMGYTHSYSPGYCSWHVREQENLFKIMPEKPCGITLNESNLMFPEKSVSGIFGLGETVQPMVHSCEICGMVTCY